MLRQRTVKVAAVAESLQKWIRDGQRARGDYGDENKGKWIRGENSAVNFTNHCIHASVLAFCLLNKCLIVPQTN